MCDESVQYLTHNAFTILNSDELRARLILDPKTINKRAQVQKFGMEGLGKLAHIARREDHILSVDSKDYLYALGVAEPHLWQFKDSTWQLWCFVALLMGATISPRIKKDRQYINGPNQSLAIGKGVWDYRDGQEQNSDDGLHFQPN
ncbi:hypothetical protein SARC_06402 [Sphaeroforma arctica JP610]|uniref:Uncharacterized protein n=1 Tax=Sphaeroforma arctica JP610 TaxID=667725 RepID=A0A0L0FXJ0_9EUKA|nr:hypothetical protein SARC_06402 [Sphaeroforma arctica JP610]KNC81271.1 hypothetical protein SARC_06402 [Sphaeroforma arctica JP610]|eukprot:XP_014155173.1 hypothetical protein SARC_06402 [Sphaeroforma arctica JP610]